MQNDPPAEASFAQTSLLLKIGNSCREIHFSMMKAFVVYKLAKLGVNLLKLLKLVILIFFELTKYFMKTLSLD